MKTLRVLLTLLVAIFIVGCGSATDLTTARSIDDVRLEVSKFEVEPSTAPLLDCRDSRYCGSLDSYEYGSAKVYVWEHNYQTLGGMEMFPLFIEVRRPEAHSWDKIVLELNNGQWYIGVYGISSWHKQLVSEFPVAVGMTNESWAVVISPNSVSTFDYVFVSDYWE